MENDSEEAVPKKGSVSENVEPFPTNNAAKQFASDAAGIPKVQLRVARSFLKGTEQNNGNTYFQLPQNQRNASIRLVDRPFSFIFNTKQRNAKNLAEAKWKSQKTAIQNHMKTFYNRGNTSIYKKAKSKLEEAFENMFFLEEIGLQYQYRGGAAAACNYIVAQYQ